MDEQEKRIKNIQETMHYCITGSLRTLTDKIENKGEYLDEKQMVEIEKKEYIRVVDELEDSYNIYPAVRCMRDDYDTQDFLWDSTFIESLNKEEKHRWFHSRIDATYQDFCKDNTIFDSALPFFSVLCRVIVSEKYKDYLKQRKNFRETVILQSEMQSLFSQKHDSEDEVLEKKETEQAAVQADNEENQPDAPMEYTFEHEFDEDQIDTLTFCVNEVKMFKGGDITQDQLKSLFDCQHNHVFRSRNNRILSYFFSRLAATGFISEQWQAVIARNKLIKASRKDDYLKQADLSSSKFDAEDGKKNKTYAKIDRYIEQL